MSLFDFIKGLGNGNSPQIDAVIQDAPIMNSKEYPLPGTIAEQPKGNGLFNNISGKVKNGISNLNLFDKYANPTNEGWGQATDENGDTVLNTAAGTPVIQNRGFLNDFSRGFNDNYNNRFNVNNWGNNTLENMPKNFATRAGEAFGTAGRVLNSPLGRGLLTAGIVKATGGDGLEALAYGAESGVLNQQNRMNDQLYRNALKDYGYDTSNIGGYIDKDTFNSIANTGVKMQNSYYQNELKKLQIQKQQILNSNLPEMQKAKLIQENAKAEYAIQMQQAKINAYNNGTALGWANYGLKVDKAQRDAEQQDLENRITEKIMESLSGGNKPSANNGGGKTKSGVNYKVVG